MNKKKPSYFFKEINEKIDGMSNKEFNELVGNALLKEEYNRYNHLIKKARKFLGMFPKPISTDRSISLNNYRELFEEKKNELYNLLLNISDSSKNNKTTLMEEISIFLDMRKE